MNSMFGATGRRGSRGMSRGDSIPSGYEVGQLQNFTPEQMNLFKNSFQHVGPDSYLSRLASGDQSMFGEIEAPAFRQFNSQLGNISSRFSAGAGGPGAMSSRRSSGFQNETTAAASNFAQDLQAQRQGLQRQAIQDLMGMSNQLLNQRPYERTLAPKQQKESSGWGGLIGAGLGGVGGFFAGGPMGALKGAQLGYGVGSAF